MRLDTIAMQRAAVGSVLEIDLRAEGGDEDQLRFDFTSGTPAIESMGEIRPRGSGMAGFSWTPGPEDVGMHSIEFSVTDGDSQDRQAARVEVRGAGEGEGSPSFIAPSGTGTTLDLNVQLCLDVEVEVEDGDSATVMIDQGQPRIDTATIQSNGPKGARWHWCPTQAEIDAQDRYMVNFTADDGDNPRVTKDFEIRLVKPTRTDCPGQAPVVNHTPANQNTILSLRIEAQVTDDLGIKGPPVLYHSTTRPADPPVLSTMTQINMTLESGDQEIGSWYANVPNPVASMPAGASATVYYVIVAQDDDDAAGSCDHRTQSPARNSYEMRVTVPSGGGGTTTLGLCSACTADSQCGDGDDNCIHVGTTSATYCGKSCSSNVDCQTGYVCSSASLTSVGGASARQCVPSSGSCTSSGGGGGACSADAYEPNDTRSVAAGKPALATGTYSNLKICPLSGGTAYEEDWFKIDVGSSSDVTVSISGGTGVDIDLQLTSSTGSSLGQSTSLSSNESVSSCVAAGTYFVRVYGWLPAGSTATMSSIYSLTWSRTSSTCGGGGGGSGITCDAACPSTLDYAGTCDAGVLKYCDAGRVICQTCASGTTCGYDSASTWYACLSDTVTPTCGGACGSIDYNGTCNGNELRYCSSGVLQCSDCGSNTCGYDTTNSYYACLASSLPCGGTCPSWLDADGTCETSTSLKYCAGGSIVCETCSGSQTCGWDFTNDWYACQ